jgi:hypothetical protein
MNELKNRGVEDVLIAVVGGLAKAPAALMRSPIIVVDEPTIEIGLQLVAPLWLRAP